MQGVPFESFCTLVQWPLYLALKEMPNEKPRKKMFPYLLITIDYQRTVIFRRVPNTQTLNNIFFQIGQQNTVPNIFCLLSSLKTFGDRTFFFLHNLLFGKHKHCLKKVKKVWKIRPFYGNYISLFLYVIIFLYLSVFHHMNQFSRKA